MFATRLPSRPGILALPVVAAFGLCVAAHAASPPQRLGLCASCHGNTGMATAANIPNLAGQNLEYLRNAIAQYRSGARSVAAMRAATGMLSATDIDRILVWYADQKPTHRPADS